MIMETPYGASECVQEQYGFLSSNFVESMPKPPFADVQTTAELAVPLLSFAVGHVHGGELDRNVALRSEHSFAIGVHSPAHEDAQE
jgi:hypothetical protein